MGTTVEICGWCSKPISTTRIQATNFSEVFCCNEHLLKFFHNFEERIMNKFAAREDDGNQL